MHLNQVSRNLPLCWLSEFSASFSLWNILNFQSFSLIHFVHQFLFEYDVIHYNVSFSISFFILFKRWRKILIKSKSSSHHFWLFGHLVSFFSFANRANGWNTGLESFTMKSVAAIGIYFQWKCNESIWHFYCKLNSRSLSKAMAIFHVRAKHLHRWKSLATFHLRKERNNNICFAISFFEFQIVNTGFSNFMVLRKLKA